MFEGKVGAYPSEVPSRKSTLRDLPANIRLSWKGLQGSNTLAYTKIHKLRQYKVL